MIASSLALGAAAALAMAGSAAARRIWSREDAVRLRRRFDAGETTAQIAAAEGVTLQAVADLWRRHRLSGHVRGRRRVYTDEQAAAWRRMYLDGMSWAEVGATVGLSANVVRKRVERWESRRWPSGSMARFDYGTADRLLGARASKRLSGRETRLERDGNDIRVVYHRTPVVTLHPDGTYTLRANGWETLSTLQRFHDYSPARVFGRGRPIDTFYIAHRSDPFHERFFDGARVDASGVLLNPREPVRRIGSTNGRPFAFAAGDLLVGDQGGGIPVFLEVLAVKPRAVLARRYGFKMTLQGEDGEPVFVMDRAKSMGELDYLLEPDGSLFGVQRLRRSGGRVPQGSLNPRDLGSPARKRGLTSSEVAAAWAGSRFGVSKTGDYWTDGETLWSYKLTIGQTIDGRKIVWDYRASPHRRSVSLTTSRHVDRAAAVADEVWPPEGVARLDRPRIGPPDRPPPRHELRPPRPGSIWRPIDPVTGRVWRPRGRL